MTTSLLPPEQSAGERPLRTVQISANLLPMEIVESRRERKVRNMVLAVLAALLVVMSGWYAIARYQTADVQDTLTSLQDEASGLQNQQHKYSATVTTQAQAKTINDQLAGLFGNDLQWSALMAKIRAAAGNGIDLTGITASVDDAKTAVGAGGVTVLPNTASSRPIGSVTVIGSGSSKPVVAAFVDALAKIPALGNPYINSVTQAGSSYEFTVKLDLLSAALAGRYAKKAGAK